MNLFELHGDWVAINLFPNTPFLIYPLGINEKKLETFINQRCNLYTRADLHTWLNEE